jgi:hypothetical protein
MTRLGFALLCAANIAPLAAASDGDIQIVVRPDHPFIESRDDRQFVNFDFLIMNKGSRPYRLVAIKLSVFDRAGKLELARELNENGRPPALDMVGGRLLTAGALIDIYQPFYEFGSEVDLARMHVEFLFVDAARPAPPVSIAADQVASVDVRPKRPSLAAYCLPLRDLVLVHDGHDFIRIIAAMTLPSAIAPSRSQRCRLIYMHTTSCARRRRACCFEATHKKKRIGCRTANLFFPQRTGSS